MIRKVSKKQASEIIENRVPVGCFYRKEGDIFIGIDNSTGDAWVEEFKTKNSCIRWLEGEGTHMANGTTAKRGGKRCKYVDDAIKHSTHR